MTLSLKEKLPACQEGHEIGSGLQWPASDTVGKTGIISHAKKHFPAAMHFVKNRRRVIQAGGNVGVYPIELARYFTEVHTFEPIVDNFLCLRRNTMENCRIFANCQALGNGEWIDFDKIEHNCGTYRPVKGDKVKTIKIDSLGLENIDLIWLDVEGHETKVLEGARKTIERDKPVLIFEDIGLGDSPRKWAEANGYNHVHRIRNDDIMVCTPNYIL